MTVAKKKGKKALTLRQVLNVIDTALARENDTSIKVWDVLTALRGPDVGAEYMKKETGTVYVRRAAFPKTTKRADEDYGYLNGAQFSAGAHAFSVPTKYEGGHFNGHLRRAAEALNLEAPNAEDVL